MDWTSIITDILYSLITTIVPIISYQIIKLVKAKRDKLAKEDKEYIIKNTILDALDLIGNAVTCTTQTYVDALKAEGKFDKEAQEIAFNKTKNIVMELLSEESKGLLQTVYSDLDQWINMQIESYTKRLK